MTHCLLNGGQDGIYMIRDNPALASSFYIEDNIFTGYRRRAIWAEASHNDAIEEPFVIRRNTIYDCNQVCM